jgi:hypothetical protein
MASFVLITVYESRDNDDGTNDGRPKSAMDINRIHTN